MKNGHTFCMMSGAMWIVQWIQPPGDAYRSYDHLNYSHT